MDDSPKRHRWDDWGAPVGAVLSGEMLDGFGVALAALLASGERVRADTRTLPSRAVNREGWLAPQVAAGQVLRASLPLAFLAVRPFAWRCTQSHSHTAASHSSAPPTPSPACAHASVALLPCLLLLPCVRFLFLFLILILLPAAIAMPAARVH